GLQDILIAVIDGLKGFPEAITAVFPAAEIQTCIVHLIRNSLSFCNWKQRQPVARELKQIYEAETAELAAKRLEDFAEGPWGRKLPAIVQSWRRVWEQVIPFFAYPKEIRKIIYTTNAIESLHMQLRKVLKNRGHFPSDEAATKLIYLALRDITKKWKNPPGDMETGSHPISHSLWSQILCRGDLKTMKPLIARARKTDAGLRRRPAATRDLPTIAFFRAGPLLRRNGPVTAILAAARPGAIMDKSGRRFVATN